jgi:hypothetical protein
MVAEVRDLALFLIRLDKEIARAPFRHLACEFIRGSRP